METHITIRMSLMLICSTPFSWSVKLNYWPDARYITCVSVCVRAVDRFRLWFSASILTTGRTTWTKERHFEWDQRQKQRCDARCYCRINRRQYKYIWPYFVSKYTFDIHFWCRRDAPPSKRTNIYIYMDPQRRLCYFNYSKR